jgi:hypothetical protein
MLLVRWLFHKTISKKSKIEEHWSVYKGQSNAAGPGVTIRLNVFGFTLLPLPNNLRRMLLSSPKFLESGKRCQTKVVNNNNNYYY